MRLGGLLVLMSLLAPVGASAQIEQCGFFAAVIGDIVVGRAAGNQDNAIRLLDVGQGARCFAVYVAGTERMLFHDFVRRFEGSRTDKQSGPSAGAAGSTSVVSQGPVARVLSVAAEYGALTQSINGQTVTVRGNLAGVPSALVRQNVFPYCVPGEPASDYCVGDTLLSFLRRVSFSVSLDAMRSTEAIATPLGSGVAGEAQPVAVTAARTQVTSWSGRVELWNRRDTTSTGFVESWRSVVGEAMDQASGDLLLRAGTFAESVIDAPGYDAWQARHAARIRAAGLDRALVVAALHEALRDLVVIVRPIVPDLETQAQAALASYGRFFLDQDTLLESLATKGVFALEYTSNRPAGQQRTSQVRLIVDWPLTARTKVIANGALTVFDRLPAQTNGDVSRYRDAQVAVQVDHGLSNASIVGPATLAVAYYYQYQHSPVLLPVDPLNPIPGVTFVGLPDTAATVFVEPGHIRLLQVRLTLAPGGSSVKVPIAISRTNRTELIARPAWRAQVGVTYDFDSLFALASRALGPAR